MERPTQKEDDFGTEFARLAKAFVEQTMYFLSPEDVRADPSYKEIRELDMTRAIPLVMDQIENQKSSAPWFLLLRDWNDDQNPVQPHHMGQREKMAATWRKLFQDRGYQLKPNKSAI